MAKKNDMILDRDLARLYGVETRVLNQAVQRNIERFPEDFMFQLTKEDVEFLKSQNVILETGKSKSSQNAISNYDEDMSSQIATSSGEEKWKSQIVISNIPLSSAA